MQEKKQERERRKTQEISLMKRTPSQENTDFTTLPRVRNHRASSSSIEISPTEELVANKFVIGKSVDVLKRNSIVLDRPPSAIISETTSTVTLPNSEVNLLKRRPSARTPGFTTRRTQSIKKMRQWDDLKSIDMHGYDSLSILNLAFQF